MKRNRNSLNSAAITEAYLNPTPENKHLRDQYQVSYPVYNRLREHGEKLPERVKEIHGDRIALVNKQYYQGRKVPLKWYCNDCKHVWTQTPDMVLNEKLGCPECAKLKPRKPPIKATPEEKAQAVALYNEVKSFRKVSEMTGRSMNAIRRWVSEASPIELCSTNGNPLQQEALDLVSKDEVSTGLSLHQHISSQ